MFKGKLIMSGNNAKTVKGDGTEYETAIMYLAPADMVDGVNLCPLAVLAGCKSACLNTAGRGAMNNVQAARIRKTIMWRDDRDMFMDTLIADLTKFAAYCERKGVKPVVRLNGTSDIQWERIKHNGKTVFERFPNIQFYDYTKIVKRAYNAVRKDWPANYSIVLSQSGANYKYSQDCYKAHRDTGIPMIMVVRNKAMVASALRVNERRGFANSVDGDKDDLRFLDKPGSVIYLAAKGKAKRDTTGFVMDI